jgi:hypothetical protein
MFCVFGDAVTKKLRHATDSASAVDDVQAGYVSVRWCPLMFIGAHWF